MNSLGKLQQASIGPRFLNVLAMTPFAQSSPLARRYDLDNGPFMRDTAVVTLAFGNLIKADDEIGPRFELSVPDTPYMCQLVPLYSFAMGMLQHSWMYGYHLNILAGDTKSVESMFVFSTPFALEPEAMPLASADASVAIAPEEGNGARLNALYRQITLRLPEAKAQLGLSY